MLNQFKLQQTHSWGLYKELENVGRTARRRCEESTETEVVESKFEESGSLGRLVRATVEYESRANGT